MCGVAGLMSTEPRDLSPIFDMTAVQAHRGPDGAGHALFAGTGRPDLLRGDERRTAGSAIGRIALGHRRLSIIDCTDSGHQPMSYADGRYWITYNGEVYNYRELREELSALGYGFRSESDTEVILAAYAAWGVNCFSRFNGMWALAIWDTLECELVMSRDRFGVKPLHVRTHAGTLSFASEIKGARRRDRRREGECSWSMTTWSMAWSMRTIKFFFTDHCLPPGCYAIVSPKSLVVTPKSFWSLSSRRFRRRPSSVVRGVPGTITSAVKLRMRSDIPGDVPRRPGFVHYCVRHVQSRKDAGPHIHGEISRAGVRRERLGANGGGCLRSQRPFL